MRKLRLKLEELAVESFTTGAGEGRGTVEGRDSTTDCTQTESGEAYCVEGGTYTCSCPDHFTCQAGCQPTMRAPGNTCYATCAGTCQEPSCFDMNTCYNTCTTL